MSHLTEAPHQPDGHALPQIPTRTTGSNSFDNPRDPDQTWGIQGDPALLVEAARKLRLGIEIGVYRSHPPGEYAMLSLARLLDAIAFSIHIDGAVDHTVVSGATEIGRHVLHYLLPTVQLDTRRR
jgi:hypothetical protein